MSLSLIILLVVAVVIVGFLGFVVTRPNSFRLERSTVVNAAPAKVFPLINDFHNWTRWSPFEGMDAELKRTYDGPANGLGAIYGWDGAKTGVGRMEILESRLDARVLIKLDFHKPFEAHNLADFMLEPAGDGAKVTWAMSGPSPFITKLMGIVFPMEKMLGPQFEQGLAAMKAAAEG